MRATRLQVMLASALSQLGSRLLEAIEQRFGRLPREAHFPSMLSACRY
jgi:hypothetical protein